MVGDGAGSERQTEQVLDQVGLLRRRETQAHTAVVVIDQRVQRREAPVVVEPSFDRMQLEVNR